MNTPEATPTYDLIVSLDRSDASVAVVLLHRSTVSSPSTLSAPRPKNSTGGGCSSNATIRWPA
ncbi:MAG: hypothetical protein IPL39_01420 [Opitutaceae bacterium]|nr:hypothetical protein [Opitutaceae bacterium]